MNYELVISDALNTINSIKKLEGWKAGRLGSWSA